LSFNEHHDGWVTFGIIQGPDVTRVRARNGGK